MLAASLIVSLSMGQGAPLVSTMPARFHNRPGASVAARDTDIGRCRAIATGPLVTERAGRSLTPPVGDPALLPRAVAARSGDIDTCMADRGWRLYALSPREQTTWTRLSAAARLRLAERLTGADHPHLGHLVRPAQRFGLRALGR
ncbi:MULTISPECIES: hypothetical protein [unclassified Sphingomonas]|jgi:hypothetical protein|uniref:hypothetical protein n=1 Tax=unclassified Sphingomonas TaxID=196159 RepID=UPI000E100684|nr:hypothetical protein [Sphingomonas sp. FARSPH]AXJ97426.1 hypothetical protein DM480_17185 [Sphingomonas sp. FARSPH]